MRYMCIVHVDPAVWPKLSEAERAEIDRSSMAYDQELQRNGNYIVAEIVEGPESATLVRVRNGQQATTDGPYMETKEHMAGFILIEARDMNDAIRLAAGIPLAALGTIEIRAIYTIPTPPEL
ncbi:MAG: YciI family protein [Devosia sp.]